MLNSRIAVFTLSELGRAINGKDGSAIFLDIGEALGGRLGLGEVVDIPVRRVRSGEEVPVSVAGD